MSRIFKTKNGKNRWQSIHKIYKKRPLCHAVILLITPDMYIWSFGAITYNRKYHDSWNNELLGQHKDIIIIVGKLAKFNCADSVILPSIYTVYLKVPQIGFVSCNVRWTPPGGPVFRREMGLKSGRHPARNTIWSPWS